MSFLVGTWAFVTAMVRTGEVPVTPLLLYGIGAVPVSLRSVVPEAALNTGLLVMAVGVGWTALWLLGQSHQLAPPALLLPTCRAPVRTARTAARRGSTATSPYQLGASRRPRRKGRDDPAVRAALADVQFDGQSTDLPLRAGPQVIYLAAAVAVMLTHRHVPGAVRLDRLPCVRSVVIPLPQVAGSAMPQDGPGIVLVSRLQLRRLQDVPALLRHSLQVRRGFRTVPGAISLRLAANPTRGTFWTWSSWADEAAMDEYVRSDRTAPSWSTTETG